jgi:putative two-component system response regulator
MSEKQQTILIVDDSADDIALLDGIMRGTYQVKAVMDGPAAIKSAQGSDPPDLILLDIIMPGMDGYEVCKKLQANPSTAGIPIIFLTAKSGPLNEKLGLDLGAEDYISKPPSPPIMMARIQTHLRLKALRDFLSDKNEFLEKEVSRRTKEIGMIQDVAMIALGSLAGTRDNETGNHIRRTRGYVKALSLRLKSHPRFKLYLTPETIELLFKSAPLHDIGKVGIPDRILKKPGPLDTEEFEIMKTHTTIGKDALLAAMKSLYAPLTSFLSLARDIAWSHHERWDGTGYPRALAGEEIPFAGRIMSIPDVYDALISERVYKRAYKHEEAIEIIKKGIGSQFDPDVGKTFVDISDQFNEIAMNNKDA